MRLHLWGTFANPTTRRREAWVGYCALAIEITGIFWLAGGTNPASTLNGNTTYGNIFTFKKTYRDIDVE